jgi:hypothetical protein
VCPAGLQGSRATSQGFSDPYLSAGSSVFLRIVFFGGDVNMPLDMPGRNKLMKSTQARFLVCAAAVLVSFANELQAAAVYCVSNTNDAGSGSLRAAIAEANNAGGGEIRFCSVTGTIILLSPLPILAASINIIGPGPHALRISGNNQVRVFAMNSGTTNMLSGLTITAGRGLLSPGGGIANAGDLRIEDCVVSDCDGDYGGGIYNSANLLLTNCLITSCVAAPEADGGGILNRGSAVLCACTVSNCLGFWGGGIESWGVLAMTNSTIVDNGAAVIGGGLVLGGTNVIVGSTLSGNDAAIGGGLDNDVGESRLFNCTVSGNTADSGSGMANGPNISGDSVLYLNHCTVVSNVPATGARSGGVINDGLAYAQDCIFAENGSNDISGGLISQGYNLIRNTNACTITGDETGNIYGADPLLGPLQDNGGPTWTCALLPGSPAIDAGSSGGLPADQRGVPRPYDVPGVPNAADGSDIGAFEWRPPPLVFAEQTVERLLALVSQSGLDHHKPLIATLYAALKAINRGNLVAAANELHAFENKVRAQVAPLDPTLAETLIQMARQVIDALEAEGPHKHAPKVHSINRQVDGKVHLRFSGPAGQVHLVEGSPNLVDWEVLGVATEQGEGSFEFEDAKAAGLSSRFYRVRQLSH